MHEGLVSSRLGLKGIPSAAEAIMVARDVYLAELTGGHAHICHVSCRGAVEMIRRGKDHGANITAEVTPHHLTLTDNACEGYDTNAKMNPPLREQEDVEAVRQGLKDGTLDLIASDHAPHHYESKERDFDDAAMGVVGLETSLGICLTELVEQDVLTLPELIARMSTIPAKVFHLPGGSLARGVPADVVVFDPDAHWKVDPTRFASLSRNTPFFGWDLVGSVELTLVGGNPVYSALGG